MLYSDMVESNVTIVVQKYSVVVKGIEKKLQELGYHVTTISSRFEEIPDIAYDTDIFINYLAGEILSESARFHSFAHICDLIKNTEKPMLLIADKKDYGEFLNAMPALGSYTWVEKPVDMERLAVALDKLLNDEDSGEKKKILIVDDDPTYASLVREWIKDDYDTEVVTAGMQAISYLVRNGADLVLLDYEMPAVDGPEVLKLLRLDPTTKDIPVIFLTGVSTREGVSRVMSLKPNGYILKTSGRESLLKTIESCL